MDEELTKDRNCSLLPSVCGTGEYFAYTVFTTASAVLGIVTNLLNIMVFSKSIFHGSSFTFMFGLAILDFIICVFVFPTAILKCIERLESAQNSSFTMDIFEAYIFGPIASSAATSSVWLTLVMAVERFVCITWPFKAKVLFKTSRARLIISFVCVSSFTVHVPAYFAQMVEGRQLVPSLFSHSDGFHVYLWIKTVTSKMLPILLIIISNVMLITAVVFVRRKRAMLIRPSPEVTGTDVIKVSPSAVVDHAELRISVVLISLSLIYIVSHLPEPFTDPRLVQFLFGPCSTHTHGYRAFKAAVLAAETLSYGITIVPYTALSAVYRATLWDLLRCKRM